MNNKKAKAVRALVDYDIAKYEEQQGRKVTEEERRKFYQAMKRKLKNGKIV